MSKAEEWYEDHLSDNKGVDAYNIKIYGDLRAEEALEEIECLKAELDCERHNTRLANEALNRTIKAHVKGIKEEWAKTEAYRNKALCSTCRYYRIRQQKMFGHSCWETCRTQEEYCKEVIKEVDSCLEVSYE